MSSDPSHLLFSPFQANAELELLQSILQDETSYPWNPSEPGADAYFIDLEQEVMAQVEQAGLTNWMESELTTRSQALASMFDAMWATAETPVAAPESVTETISNNLFRQFSAQIPQQFLERIVQKAQQVMAENRSLADQLVLCVQELLPAWGEEDLYVLARPFAYAMRGGETEMLEAALRSVRCAAWTELSGIEQARLSLAIARYAIAQMPADSIDQQ